MKRSDFPAPEDGFVVTNFITVSDVARSAAFYSEVLGGQVVMEGEPTIVKLANSWVIINVGGGPTEDKPSVNLAPPSNPDQHSSFMNLRVANIQAKYEEWKSRGAIFITPPIDRGAEIRCYIRDPDNYIIEVGQASESLLQNLEP